MTRLFSILWLAALICGLYFYNPWQLELYLGSMIFIFGAAIVVFGAYADRGFLAPQSAVHKIFGAFWLVAFISLFQADVLNASLMAFCLLSAFPVTFYILTLDNNIAQMKLIARVLSAVFAVLSVWALVQYFFLPEIFDGAAKHPLANPNSLGALFNLAIFSGLGWMFLSQSVKEKWLASALTALYICGLMATSSRGAFFSLMLCLPVMLFLCRAQLSGLKGQLIFMGFIGAGIYLATAFSHSPDSGMFDRIAGTVLAEQGTDITRNRIAIWAGAIELLKDNWLFGVGIGMFFLHYNEYRVPEELSGVFHSHSDPLQFWVEFGVLGPILFYALLIAVLMRTIKTYKAADTRQRVVIIAPFMALCAVTIHTHVTFNFFNLSILYGAGFLLSVWYLATEFVLTNGKPQEARRFMMMPSRPKFLATKGSRRLLVALPFLFMLGLIVPFTLSEIKVASAKEHLNAGNLELFAKDVITSHRLSGYRNHRAHLLSASLPLSLLQDQKAQMDGARIQQSFDQAYYHLTSALAINPRSASAYYYLGQLTQLTPALMVEKESAQSAEDYFNQALKIDPTQASARMALYDILMARGQEDAALEMLEAGYQFEYKTAVVIGYYQKIAMAYLMAGKAEQHKDAMQKMARAIKRFTPQKQ